MTSVSTTKNQDTRTVGQNDALLNSLIATVPSETSQKAPVTSMDREAEKLTLLYQENAKVAAIFWDWRHKVMTNFLTGMVALFALFGWFYQQLDLRRFLFAPLLFGAFFAIITLLLDHRNATILRGCYRIGEKIEQVLHKDIFSIYSFLRKNHHSGLSYTRALFLVYAAVGLLLFFLSIAAYRLYA